MENVAYSDPPRVERIEGKTYLMSPRPRGKHHRAAFNIAHIFEGYLKGKTCMAFDDGMPVYLDGENTYIPDAMIVCDRSIIRDAGIYGAPDLVVEVLSPSTMKHDRGAKMRHYAAAGVKEYWIVDPLAEAVEAMRWAPSAYNRQPWRFAFRPDGAIEVHGLPGDYLHLDCGIAIAHLLLLRPDFELTDPPAPRPGLTPIATLKVRGKR